MFNPKDDAINELYRQDFERDAHLERQRSSTKSLRDNPDKKLHILRNTNIVSLLIIIVAVLVLTIFFTASSRAQEDPDVNIESGTTGQDHSEILYLQAAIENILSDDIDTALQHLDMAINTRLDFAPAYITRAHVWYLLSEYEFALEDATTAIGINPTDGANYYILGEIYFAQDNYEDARIMLEVYLVWLDIFDAEPILITTLIGEDSLVSVQTNLEISRFHIQD